MSDQTTAHETFIKSLLSNKFGIPLDSITITKATAGANNYSYIIVLSTPTTEELTAKDTPSQVLSCPIPKGTSRLVFRIPRPESNLEDCIRIRNEVSLMTLAREALTDVDPSLIPRIYGWSDAGMDGDERTIEEAPSYIIEEFIGGEALTHAEFKALDEDTRASIFQQLARVIKAFQTHPLPAGVTGHGGITFDGAGTMTSTMCVIRMRGPFATYRDFLRGIIQWQLEQSDAVPWLNGWREDKSEDGVSLRARIDDFMANGLEEQLAKVPDHKPVLIHGDCTLPNLHFDKSTNRLTGIIDFDFGHVTSPLSEPMFSFPHFQGFLPGVSEHSRARELVLSGYKDDDGDEEYALGRAWEAALAAEGVVRPSQVPEAELVSNLWWFGQELCQAYWQIPRVLASGYAKGKEEELRADSVKGLDKYMTHWGY